MESSSLRFADISGWMVGRDMQDYCGNNNYWAIKNLLESKILGNWLANKEGSKLFFNRKRMCVYIKTGFIIFEKGKWLQRDLNRGYG